MNKIIYQGLIIVLLFFTTWFLIGKIDWMTILDVEQRSQTVEEKLGELFWDFFSTSEKVIYEEEITDVVDSLFTKICKANKIDKDQIKLYIIEKDEINAFALPDNYLVIYSGLILASDNEEMLAGVISHELAHLELNHVMKKLLKEVGLSTLIAMTTGSGGSVVKETFKVLSSSAYDRTLEKEADLKAVDYLNNASINPEPFAGFLFKLTSDEPGIVKHLTWISTHPETMKRVEYVLEYIEENSSNNEYLPVLTDDLWETLKSNLKNRKE